MSKVSKNAALKAAQVKADAAKLAAENAVTALESAKLALSANTADATLKKAVTDAENEVKRTAAEKASADEELAKAKAAVANVSGPKNWARLLSSLLNDMQAAKDEKNANQKAAALKAALDALEKFIKGIYNIENGTDLKVAWDLLLEVANTARTNRTLADRVNRWGDRMKMQMKRVGRDLIENLVSLADGSTILEEFIEITDDSEYFLRDAKPKPIIVKIEKEENENVSSAGGKISNFFKKAWAWCVKNWWIIVIIVVIFAGYKIFFSEGDDVRIVDGKPVTEQNIVVSAMDAMSARFDKRFNGVDEKLNLLDTNLRIYNKASLSVPAELVPVNQ